MLVEPIVLALNVGSSSLKYALFRGDEALSRGEVEQQHKEDCPGALEALLAELAQTRAPAPGAVGHRLVHGGPELLEPIIVAQDVRDRLTQAIPFAPLHLPAELGLIDAVSRRLPGLMQVACFDTGFHRTLPEESKRLAIPEHLYKEGIRRYGFHGLSYEYIVDALSLAQRGRAVIAHLGSGCSLAAVEAGKSVDTTMSFTPTAGLVMSTRCGDLDPGILIYLLATHGYDAKKLEQLVDRESGLLALSQRSGDVRELLRARASDGRAALAISIFCRSIRKGIGAMAAALGGIDMLVFTGGVGAHAAEIRAEVCSGLRYLGVALDGAQDKPGAQLLSAEASRCEVRALATDEERMIARSTARLWRAAQGPNG